MEFIITEGQNWSHNHALTGMDTHRIDVFHTTDGDTGVIGIPHDLKLNLLPSCNTLFNESLVDTGFSKTELHNPAKIIRIVSNPTASSSKGIGWTDNCWKSDNRRGMLKLIRRTDNNGAGNRLTNPIHKVTEFFPIFSLVNRLERCSKDLNPFKSAHLCKFCRQVQTGLTSHTGKNTIRFLFFDDLGNDISLQWLDIGDISHVRICLNCGRVGVDQNDRYSFFTKGTAGL
ncbi:MAG: hypothetical protein BWY45_02405 [Euryarchaeota archaeon ADurb.Bin294]|nr:MAG: hypothetical protein BWY45_02405 [Euryarchaeota archaeon ADurb.Bin294]